MPLLTVGHGALDRASLARLLRAARVEQVVDVRRFPGSRRNPDVKREALDDWLPEEGVAYRWVEQLGGRRRLSAGEELESPDAWWQVAAFRAYAGYTRTPEFAEGMDVVVDLAAAQRVAVMCSEAVWWRCHRRIIADVAALARDVPVHHLMHDGRLRPHEPSAGARVAGGVVTWPG